jgi:aminoglycoside phosphotransferase (APT) family kinase protein
LPIKAEEEENMNSRSDMDTAVLNPLPANTANDPRAILRQRFEQLQDSSVALEILRSYVPSSPARVEAVCTPQKYRHDTRKNGRDDRFIMRVDTVMTTGQREAFVFKGYPDDRGQRIMRVFHAMANCPHCPPDTCPVSRPLAYIPQERLLISRWAHGQTVWAHIERGCSDLLTRIPSVLAHLYQQAEVLPEAATTAQALLDEVFKKCRKVCKRWPAAAPTVQPLMAALQKALPLLDPSPPALVHGDLNADHCFWNGRHMTLIDLDNFRYTDPAYDAGRFLAMMQRQCLPHPALMARAPELLATFRDAYLTTVPTVSTRNIAFYYALTFARKIYVDLVELHVPADWPRVVATYAHYAMAALQTGV